MTTAPIPSVAKVPATVVSVGDASEAHTVRALLEAYGFQVTVHWTGSRAELIKVLTSELWTDQTVLLSCHGVPEGIAVPDESPLPPSEIAAVGRLTGRTVVNLGCSTGTIDFAGAFQTAGAEFY